MRFFELITRLNNLASEEEVALYFKALRQNTIIWEGVKGLDFEDPKVLSLIRQNQPLNAGTLALVSCSENFDFNTLPSASLSHELLEKVMLGYEEYLVTKTPISSLDQAGTIALALIAKQKSAGNWIDVFKDFLNRMKLSSDKEFEKFWLPVLIVVINLEEDKTSYLKQMASVGHNDLVLSSINNLVLSLPFSDQRKTDLLSDVLHPLDEKNHIKALRILKQLAGVEITKNVAAQLLKKYNELDLSKRSIVEYWQDPQKSSELSFKLQAIADIASLAGDEDAALCINEKALEILDALVKKGKVKKIGLSRGNAQSLTIKEIFNDEELNEPEIQTELVYAQNEDFPEDGIPHPAKTILHSKKLIESGNLELAKEEIKTNLSGFSDNELEKILIGEQDQIRVWEPEKFVESFSEVGAHDEASRVASIYLKTNPTSIPVNLAAAKNAEATHDYLLSAVYWEALTLLQPGNDEYKRNLAKAYLQTNRSEFAFDLYKELTSRQENVNSTDLSECAELAMQLGKPTDAITAAEKMLDLEADHTRALTLIGLAHSKTGNLPAAEEYLRKATSVSLGDSRPWLLLAEIQWSLADHSKAITTLKEGLTANPGDVELQANLARMMFQEGMVSEAYPLLLEVSKTSSNLDNDLLLVEAMESLGMDGIPELLDTMLERYPQEDRFIGDYGKRLVLSGDTEKGCELLERLGEGVNRNADWKLAYLESVRKPDYFSLNYEKAQTSNEFQATLEFLNEYLGENPNYGHAQLLKAELLVFAGENASAFELFTDLNRADLGKQTLNQARVLAGLSIAGAGIGEIEISNAALDQAMSLEPEWLGLQVIMARNLHLMGEDADAVNQALKIIEQAPPAAENQLWAINFLLQIGGLSEAGKLLKESLQQYPDHVGLTLLSGELSLNGTDTESVVFESDHLFELLQNESNDTDLTRAAVIYAELNDHDRTLWCLKKAAGSGNDVAKVHLAGLFRINHDYMNARDTLEQIEATNGLISLFIAETIYSSGVKEEIAIPLDKNINSINEYQFIDLFLPSEWKEMLLSTHPAISMGTKIAFKTGDFSTIIEDVRSWIDSEPENPEARVYGIELALASSNYEWYSQLVNVHLEDKRELFGKVLTLLTDEAQLDRGVSGQELVESYDLFDSIKAEEPEKIALIRKLRRVGRFPEAETTFEMAMSVFINLDEKPIVVKLGILRNLAKCAHALDKWSESNQIIDQALELAPASDVFNILHIQGATLALEFQTRIGSTVVRAHGFSNIKEYANQLLTTVNNLHLSESGQEVWDYWVNRLSLGLDPTKETIAKLASRAPSEDDAAVMMAALRHIGQIETALKVGKKYPDNPSVLFETAICLWDNQPDVALEMLMKSLEIDPFQPLVLRRISYLHEQSKNLPEALKYLEKALELWSNEFGWHVDAAAIWKQLGNTEKPLEHLQIANLFASGDLEIRRLLGEAYLLAGKTKEARPHLMAVVEKYPNDHDTWILLSELHQASGELDLALQAADKAAVANPSGVKARLQAGRISWAKGEIKTAIVNASAAISLDPQDPANYVFLARLSKEQGNKVKALELLEKAMHCRPATLQTVIEHANLIKEINGVIAARDLIASFSQKFPENPDLLTLLADAEDQCGDVQNAEVAAKKAMEIKPEEKAIHMLLGRIVEKSGNLEQAAQYYSHAVSLEPSLVEGYKKLSELFIKQHEFSQARDVLEQGIGKVPGNVDLYLSCAALLKEAKDYRGAEQMLRKASTIDPRNVSIHRQLGAILALNMVHQSQEVGSQV